MIDTYSLEAGLMMQPIIELSTMDSIMELVRLGVGATILPKSYLIHLNDPQIHVIPIVDPAPRKEVGIVYRKEKFINTALEALYVN